MLYIQVLGAKFRKVTKPGSITKFTVLLQFYSNCKTGSVITFLHFSNYSTVT